MNRILYEYKEKLQKRSHVYYRNLSEDEKIKKKYASNAIRHRLRKKKRIYEKLL